MKNEHEMKLEFIKELLNGDSVNLIPFNKYKKEYKSKSDPSDNLLSKLRKLRYKNTKLFRRLNLKPHINEMFISQTAHMEDDDLQSIQNFIIVFCSIMDQYTYLHFDDSYLAKFEQIRNDLNPLLDLIAEISITNENRIQLEMSDKMKIITAGQDLWIELH